MNAMLCRVAAYAVLLAMAVPALAQSEAEDAAELDALLDVLAEETEIATKSKQNADYVPGIVSVLHSDELEALGARTVLDGLALIPGVEINRDDRGGVALRVRAIDFFFNGGNVKVLVDSLPFSRETAFQNSTILLMPLGQVERIEMIRGPGSGVHGDFAFVGLVNIVTRHAHNKLAVQAGSGSQRAGLTTFSSAGRVQFSGNLSSWRSDRYDSPSPFSSDERRDYASLRLGAGNFTLSAAAIAREFDGVAPPTPPAPGPPGTPPPPPPAPGTTVPVFQDEDSAVVEARYIWNGANEAHAALWANLLSTDMQRGNSGFDGDRWEAGAQGLRRFGRHLLLAQATIGKTDIDDALLPARAGPGGTVPAFHVQETRDLKSITLQDQIDFGERVQVTAGLRYDDIEDIDSLVAPRLAVLWRMAERHALKAQYAEGFRSPHYIELYAGGTAPLTHTPFERIVTTELAYVYRDERSVLRATLFRSDVEDMIFPRGTPNYNRDLELQARGVELEWTRQLSAQLKLIATLSDTDTEDGRNLPAGETASSFGEPDWLGNLGLIARLGESWTLGAHWNHVGDRDVRTASSDGYDQVNIGATWRIPRVEGLTLRLGVRNLTDAEVTHVAQQPPAAYRVFDYGERIWSASLSWEP